MFENIQKKILLKYPLLWNTKFVPMMIIGFLINLICFIIGFIDGSIDFRIQYYSLIDEGFYFFISLIIVLILIVWLINYFKNNAFKVSYPKSKNSIFYEWLQIFIIILLFASFEIPLNIGKIICHRNYLSKEQVNQRCEVISKADFFINGYFESPEIDSTKSILNDTTINGEYLSRKIVTKDYVKIFGKKYSTTSLINRKVYEFNYLEKKEDSLNTIEMRKLLFQNNEIAVKKIMQDYLDIHNESKLSTNLNVNKWFEITYNYPDFKKFQIIRPSNPVKNNNYYASAEAIQIDDKYGDVENVTVANNQSFYSNYYLEKEILNHNYGTLLTSYEPIFGKFDFYLIIIYCAFGLSILILSFRLTSGKSWMIALVITILLNIVLGLLSAISRNEYLYLYLSFFIIVFMVFRLIFAVVNKENFKYSKIVINLKLWYFSALIPIVFFIYYNHYKDQLYNTYLNNYEKTNLDPHLRFLEDNFETMFAINLVFSILILFFFSRLLRTWKGLAEE